MKLVSFENLLKYNELLNQKTVRSVNSVKPDSNGNVDITIPEVDLSGLVKSVNNIQPDADGNINISSNGTNIVGVTNNRNLGEIFYSALPLESSQVHLLDGSVLTDSSELYDYLESIKDSNPDLFTTDSEFNSEVESTGKCSKFVINTDNKTVRIPKGDSNNYIVIKNYDTKFEFNQPFSLLEPKWSDVPLNNPSWLLSNGQINSQENYPSVYELLLNEYNNGALKSETIGEVSISFKQLDNGHKIVTDKTAYESILKNTGTAWYYLLDLDSRTFILPQTNGYMKYGNSNEFIKQSLPNIKGQTGWVCTSGDDETTLPFSKILSSDYGSPSGPGTSYPAKFTRVGFDASTYSDIYANDANVNPNSVQGYLYFYVGDCVGISNSVNLGNIKDKLDLDIANLKTELNNLKGKNISLLSPVHYSRSSNFETSGRTSIKLPSYLSLMVNGHYFRNDTEVTLDITDSANWDSTETDYTVSENRAGKDFYIYAVDDNKVTKSVHVVLSANSTVPVGYTESSSRKIGGFHCLCADVGTPTWRNPATLKDEAHWLSGYAKGDILPYSVWDLLHRAESSNEGMVFSPETHMWYDIYLASWDGSKLVSVFGGVTADGASSKPFHGEMFAECAGQINKELISRDEFIVVAKGSNENTNIYGSTDAGTTGGHVDTNNRRMISNIGLEDCCGYLWQWCKQSGGTNGSGGWNDSVYNSAVDGSAYYGSAYGYYFRALVGGPWADSSHCGSRYVCLNYVSAIVSTNFGAHLSSRERVITGL